MKTKKSFSEIYSFPGFRARSTFKKGILGDPKARVVKLERRQKNDLFDLWHRIQELLRSAYPPGSGSRQRGYADLSGIRIPQSQVQALSGRETGIHSMAVEQQAGNATFRA
jgi:hypothetical protein